MRILLAVITLALALTNYSVAQLFKGSSGSGTVSSGTAQDVAGYVSTGTTVAPLATGGFYWNSGLFVVGGITVDPNGAFGAGTGISFGDGDTEIFESVDDDLEFHIGGNDRYTMSGSAFSSAISTSFRLRQAAGDEASPQYVFEVDADTGMYRIAANNLGFSVGGVKFFELGGSQTALVQDTTLVTGDTKLIVKEGAASSNNLFELQANNGDLGWVFLSPTAFRAGRATQIRIDGWGSTLAGTSLLLSTIVAFQATSGDQIAVHVDAPFTPSSGTSTFQAFQISPTIDQTGGADGITRGLFINPILTAAADFRAIEVAAGKSIFLGDVGIGTAIPATAAHVVRGLEGSVPGSLASSTLIAQGNEFSTSNALISLLAGTSGKSILEFADSGDRNIGFISYDHAANSMQFGTNAISNRIFIDSAGNVGMGTANPSAPLHIFDPVPLLRLQDSTGVGDAAGAFIEYFDSTVRQGWIGFGSSSNSNLTVNNEVSGGHVLLSPGTTADVKLLAGDIYTEGDEWQEFTGSTIGGFTGTPTTDIWYKRVGKTVFINYFISGTSNATTFTFTLPITQSSDTNTAVKGALQAIDNGTLLARSGLASTFPSSTAVDLFTSWSGGGWTASGTKEARGQFWYQTP